MPYIDVRRPFASILNVSRRYIRRYRTRRSSNRRRRPTHARRHIPNRRRARPTREVFFKCENLQRAGAFKFRGAYNALSRLSPDERRRGVVAFSSGNHAQAVALAGQLLDIPRVIVMPTDAPAVKRAATTDYGAEIVLYDREHDDREAIGRTLADAARPRP